MEELTDRAKRMLEALKAEETPSKASSDRMWAAVAGAAAAGAVAGLSKGKLLLLGALGVTGVVAVVILGGRDPSEPERAGAAGGPGEGAVAIQAAPEPEPEAPPVVEPAPARAPEPVPTPEPEPTVDTTEPAPKAPRASGVPSKASVPKPAPSASVAGSADLERELSLLAQAKRALRSGDAAGALASVKAHGKEFPRSTFGEERDLLRMTALCELGEREQARREADEFLRRNPSSALSTQVRRVCEGE